MLNPFNIYNFLSNPYKYLLGLQKKYHDPFPLSFPGVPKIWLTANPEFAKSIFQAPLDSFKASENNPVAPLLGHSGLIMMSGSPHLGQRKEFTPHFSKKNLLPIASSIQRIFLKNFEQQKNLDQISLQKFALQNTLQIILTFLFPNLSPSELLEAEGLTEKFLSSYSPSFLFIPQWVPGTWSQFNQKKVILDDRFYDFFLKTIQTNNEGFLAKLQGQSKDEILDHIRTFIVAGHETSATSLVWALFYIHQDRDLKTKLVSELKIKDKLSSTEFLENLLQNQYLEAVVNETLRIRPPVPFVTRKIINRVFKLGEHEFNQDEEIGVCIALLHRDTSVWHDPEDFIPERFIDKKYLPHEYAPFGGGTRKCIGAELALLELKILIAHFLLGYESELLEAPEPISNVLQITIGPKRPILVKFQKRDLSFL
jgi:cytochrome P450